MPVDYTILMHVRLYNFNACIIIDMLSPNPLLMQRPTCLKTWAESQKEW